MEGGAQLSPARGPLLAELILGGGRAVVDGERLAGHPAGTGNLAALPDPVPARAGHTNRSLRFGDVAILKLYSRPEPGPHPEVETGLHLARRARFPHAAPFLGWLERERDGAACGVLHAFLPGGASAWDLVREAFASGSAPDAGEAARLGELTATLHRALADDGGEEAFRVEPLSGRYRAGFHRSSLDLLSRVLPRLPGVPGEEVRRRLLAVPVPAGPIFLQRVHGDYHLDQVLHARGGLFVLDFEGEPDRPLAERRAKHPPEKDLAGMVRSFHYAACAAGAAAGAHEGPVRAFLDGYGAAGGRFDRVLLGVFELTKAIYEAGYELDHRPDWLPIPLAGIHALLGEPMV